MTRYTRDLREVKNRSYVLESFQGKPRVTVTPRNFTLEAYFSPSPEASLSMEYHHRILFHGNGDPPVEIARGKRNVLWRIVLGSDEIVIEHDLIKKSKGILPQELVKDIIFVAYRENRHLN